MSATVLYMSMSLDGFIAGPNERPDSEPPGSARYVTDVGEAVTLAKAGAGERNVLVHGAGVAQALLRAGLLDEIEIHLVPVLLGGGRSLFDHLGPDHVELELTRTLHGPGVTHLHYLVDKEA